MNQSPELILNEVKFLQFDVERRNVDTRIEICCSGKPGLLLSTVNTLEALGLEIEQCVISCFNDFAMQASCSEVLININHLAVFWLVFFFFLIFLKASEVMSSCFPFLSWQQDMEQRILLSSEDVKQALFRNAGYGGRCL